MANTLIFFLVGLIIVRSVIKIVELSDFLYLALIYISVNVIRFGNIFVLALPTT